MPSPLDELYAQMGIPNPNQYSAPGTQSLMPGASPLQPYQPQQEQSVLKSLGQKVLPGIVWAGQALDKTMGARGVRGLLAGDPRELLSVLPFSDTVGLTDPNSAVHGTELLRRAGLIHGEDDDWQNVLAGIGTEIALNPATYLTLGGSALTEAGQAASKLGLLKRMSLLGRMQGIGQNAITPEIAAQAGRLGINTANIVDKPLGGLFGVGLPFKAPIGVVGTGPTAQTIAGGLGRAVDAAKYSMVGRGVGSLFDPSVEGTTSATIQRLMRGQRAAEIDSALPAAREPVAQIAQNLARSGQQLDPHFLRGVIEGQGGFAAAPEYVQAAQDAVALNANNLALSQNAGLNLSQYTSKYGTEYTPRELAELDRIMGGSQRVLSSKTGNMIGRELYTDVPGGSTTIRGMYQDPTIAGPGATLTGNPARAAIMQQHLGGDIARMTQLEHLKNVVPQHWGPQLEAELAREHDLWEKAGIWAGKLATAEPERVGAAGVGLYNADPLNDILKASTSRVYSVANANVVRSALTDPEVYAAAARGDVVPLRSVIANTGLEPNQFEADVVSSLMRQGMPMPVGGATNLMVPKAVADDIARLASAGSAEDAVAAPLRGVDSLTSLWKRFTLMAPAYFGKKLGSGVFRSLATGSNPADLAFATEAANILRSGEVIPGIAQRIPEFAGMSDAEATAALGRMGFAHQAFGRSQGGLAELAGTSGGPSSILPQIPGEVAEPGSKDILSAMFKGRTDPTTGASLDTLGQRFNPLNIRGVGGVGGLDLRNVDQFAPAVGARQLGEMVDDLTRAPQFIERLMQGYAPGAAADATKAAQFVGTDLSPFEQQVMRRVVPFYTYLRHKFPFLLNNLAANPGGLQAMGIRGAADATELSRESVPSNLGGGMAIPLGDLGDTGKQDYLTRLGLPFDEAASFLGTGPKAGQNTVAKLLGQMNPLLKAPIEAATGQHFGQEGLTDRSGPQQNLLEQLIANTPAARAYTTTQQAVAALQGQKSPAAAAINLLTGGKVAEVDPVKEKAAMERDLIEQLLSGDKNVHKFSDYYVSPQQLATLSPIEIAALRLQKSVEQRARAAKK